MRPVPDQSPRTGTGRRVRWRDVLVPRSVIGAVSMLFAASIGAAFSGAVLFAFYESQIQDLQGEVERFTGEAEDIRDEIVEEIQAERDDARAQIRAELEPLQELRASEETMQDLAEAAAPSVWFVTTRDPDGQPEVGSAFVVTSDTEQSYLLTSLHVVRASTARPSPPLQVRKGEEQLDATLWTWDEDRDLALLVVGRPELESLDWAPTDPPLALGQRVFVVSGIGGAGASITQGFVADVSGSGVQHDAAVSGAFEGGPLINSKGEVLGVATSSYAPLGFRSEDITYAPPIRSACAQVLSCPEDRDPESPGSRR